MLQIPLLATGLSYTIHVIGIPQEHFRWDLWWTEWHCERYFSKYFGLSLSVNIPPGLHNHLSPVACTLCPLAATVLRHSSSTHNNNKYLKRKLNTKQKEYSEYYAQVVCELLSKLFAPSCCHTLLSIFNSP
jgi:hypothetical protein